MKPSIREIEAIDDYNLLMKFDNNEKRVLDVKQFFKYSAFDSIKDVNEFRRVSIDSGSGSIRWNSGPDININTAYNQSMVYDTLGETILILICVTPLTNHQLIQISKEFFEPKVKPKKELFQDTQIDVIAESPEMRQVVQDILKIAHYDVPILILGESGIGKSTLLKLIYKYYDVDRGQIFINGYDINDYTLADIRGNITYISQNEMLYTDSIRNNIILDRNISENDFLNVCKMTYVDEIIKDNILGYDYITEENGSNLSGGQRQRIILARGLLKNSKIIMIDEGLSQIDIKLERIILENLFWTYQDKTFIVVSHRENNTDLYDRVIRLRGKNNDR